ncbi:MAG TPA: amidohydrolase family protein, partial [Thermodesulfovibrionales bacterium]|nr:amidohydrolase family protein [Thermodesulfovibrionales bacterium]
VLLALDALFSPATGRLNEKKTDVWVSNRFLWTRIQTLNSRLQSEGDPAKRNKRFFFGASVNPNRTDWETELEFVVEKTEAVLLKLIPSTQHITLNDQRHTSFYKALSKAGLPLLSHVGPEYSFPEGIRNQSLDYYQRLKKPLDCGVTVIAAHCASPVFPVVDKNVMKDFCGFMSDYNTGMDVRLWSDTSALSLSSRIPYIQEIVETFNPEWLVNGSDFPIPIDGWTHLPLVTHNVTPAEYISICKTKNPFDRDIRIKRAHGFSDGILENAANVLRLPKTQS